MLQETADEFFSGQFAESGLAGFGVLIAKSHLAIFQFQDAVVADGHPENVSGEVLHGGSSIADRLTVHNPILFPDGFGNVVEEIGLSQSLSELCAKDLGEGLHREEEVFTPRQPVLSIQSQGASGNQVVHVRMVCEVAPPSMKYAYHANLTADKAGVTGQVLSSSCRGAEEQVVERGLVTPSDLPERGGQSEGEHEEGGREEQRLLLLQPLLGFPVLTFWTMAVPAGMVAVLDLITLLAMVDMPAKGFRAAALDVSHGLQMAGEDPISKLIAILWTMLAEDVRHLSHNSCSITWLIDSIAGASTFCVKWV
jgi:hypothetical protein